MQCNICPVPPQTAALQPDEEYKKGPSKPGAAAEGVESCRMMLVGLISV